MKRPTHKLVRTGSVYLAVLGTAMIVSLLGMAALIGQRIQNRIVTASADIRQAQLNANTAVELALLIMKQESNWRSSRPHSNVANWFTKRPTSAGTCTVSVTDPIDSNLANNTIDPVVVLGIGYSGKAEQRATVTIDPRNPPLSSLRSAIAAGDAIDLQGDTLRTDGLISANSTSASGSFVYGKVEAVTIGGSTYSGTTTQINSDKRPTMPTWSSAFQYYRDNGAELNINSLPTSTSNNFGRNTSFDFTTDYWTGNPSAGWTGSASLILPAATIERREDINGHAACLRVDRSDKRAGAAQSVEAYLEPNQSYYIEISVYVPSLEYVGISLYTQAVGSSGERTPGNYVLKTFLNDWSTLSTTITTPNWSGPLDKAFIIVNSDATLGTAARFYIDNLIIRESLSGRLVYQKVLSPTVNQLYAAAPTNSQGLYWINCNGADLIIKRSRILGTLLVVNPGPNSRITGSVNWSPAVTGYPALLVDANTAADADITLSMTSRALSEKENGVNYNPTGAAHAQLGEDSDFADIYPSEIRGLVAIEDDLSYQNRTLLRGQVLVGDDISSSSGELEVEFQPDSLLTPPPGFLAPSTYTRRPASAAKTVAP